MATDLGGDGPLNHSFLELHAITETTKKNGEKALSSFHWLGALSGLRSRGNKLLRLGFAGDTAKVYPSSSDAGFLPISTTNAPSTATSTNSKKKKSRHVTFNINSIRLPHFFTHFCASSVLHFPGMRVLMEVDGRLHVMVKGFLASGLEGVFILNIILSLLFFSERRTTGQPRRTTGQQEHCIVRDSVLLSMVTRGIGIILALQSVFFILSIMRFMRRTGLPDMPEMFVMMAASKESVIAEIKFDIWGTISSLLETFAFAFAAGYIIWTRNAYKCNTSKEVATAQAGGAQARTKQSVNGNGYPLPRRSALFLLFIVLVMFYCNDAWMPIFHTYASFCGLLFFSPPGASIEFQSNEILNSTMLQGATEMENNHGIVPNIILIVYESLSGEYTLTDKKAVEAMPFFQNHLLQSQADNDEIFVFENSRSVSGDTADCFTGE